MGVVDADVDPQHLPEELGRILRAMIGIVARSPVAETDVEIAVRTKREMPAVVIGERLSDERRPRRAAPSQIEPRGGIGHYRIRRAAQAGDDGVAGAVREVDEEPSARRPRRKREAEQSLLAARHDGGRQIDEIRRQDRAAANHADAAVLLHDELDGPIGRILRERDWRREAGRMDTHPQLSMQIHADPARDDGRDRDRAHHPRYT